jgi:hypothetical protein
MADDASADFHDELKEAKLGKLREPLPDLRGRAWWQALELAFGLKLLIHCDEVFVILVRHLPQQGFHAGVL